MKSHDDPFLHSHSYRWGRPVAGLSNCSRARPWLALAWLPPRLPGSVWPPGNRTSQLVVVDPVSVGSPPLRRPLPALVSSASSCWVVSLAQIGPNKASWFLAPGQVVPRAGLSSNRVEALLWFVKLSVTPKHLRHGMTHGNSMPVYNPTIPCGGSPLELCLPPNPSLSGSQQDSLWFHVFLIGSLLFTQGGLILGHLRLPFSNPPSPGPEVQPPYEPPLGPISFPH